MKRAAQATETPQVGRSVPRLESWLKVTGRAEYVHNLRLGGLENSERTDVRRPLGEHHVTRIEEESGHQVQCLLPADGDHDVLR